MQTLFRLFLSIVLRQVRVLVCDCFIKEKITQELTDKSNFVVQFHCPVNRPKYW